MIRTRYSFEKVFSTLNMLNCFFGIEDYIVLPKNDDTFVHSGQSQGIFHWHWEHAACRCGIHDTIHVPFVSEIYLTSNRQADREHAVDEEGKIPLISLADGRELTWDFATGLPVRTKWMAWKLYSEWIWLVKPRTHGRLCDRIPGAHEVDIVKTVFRMNLIG